MDYIDSKTLSPNGTEEFPCFGIHVSFHCINKEPVPDYICVKVGTSRQCMMLIKLPYIEATKILKKELIATFKTKYPATIRFSNLSCYAYHFNGKSGFTGYADSFQILED